MVLIFYFGINNYLGFGFGGFIIILELEKAFRII